jgi:flavin reductase (DIM6/NTAB) family NADH-FMN oxidoreductase RutF
MSSNRGVESADFTLACSRFATGIVVASVRDGRGAPHGLTVNSFTSVSLAPPLVLVCVGHNASVLEAFRGAEYFGISILAEDQRELSARFARPGEDRFEGTAWHPGHTGVPLLAGVAATIECALHERIVAGDHDIFIGRVLHTWASDSQPLVYFGGKYRSLG